MQNDTVTDADYADLGLTPEQIEQVRRIDAGESAPEGPLVPLKVRKPVRITRVPRKEPANR